eukprot:SAG11_NODE_28632_length_319_cov_1.236364_1_plen_25_part_10
MYLLSSLAGFQFTLYDILVGILVDI